MSIGTREEFARIHSKLGVTAIDALADAIACVKRDITFMCVSGNIWINESGTAVANTTSIKLTAGQAIDLNVEAALSIISDIAGGTYQYIQWKRIGEV